MRQSLFITLVLALAPAPARAQDRDAVRALDGLAECRAIAGDAERLACFDRVAGGIVAARASGDLLVFDKKKVTAERKVRFGLVDVPDGVGAEAAARAAKVRELKSTIAGVEQGPGFGRWNLKLANGQVWQTIDPERYGPRPGSDVRLTTTVTGGFRASIAGTTPLQVKRIR